ncbi:hypothetical protein PhaeoP18_00969 [Phaeobacter piscinae]|uniref:Uncharacterized protein n=1 Tax=Phaeobacter piscinae TaxID=1580596 RepID=A0AAN1GPW2_9RHOB|nr:hypothetical protein [Phaeobacter piscinae]ATG42934.1 hypothetical protein PhaeoP13_00984 [Phaeobacter piscinae]AUR35252.1 hypothetical protein PhaeoP18_00969 [Phaeobacter piscinae]
MDIDNENYPGGFYKLLRQLEKKEVPFVEPLSALPAADADLTTLLGPLTDPGPKPATRKDLPLHHIAHKWQSLREEFAGDPEIWAVHALCIAILRRRDAPADARALFLRIWAEHGGALAAGLPTRWLISAATTFADHGDTIDQRLGGQGLQLLFHLIKLHDSERRLSGRPTDSGLPRVKGKDLDDIGLGMTPYHLPHGDLDRQMLARLWRYGERDLVLRPLAIRMLRMVMEDPRSIFGRIQRYKTHRRS